MQNTDARPYLAVGHVHMRAKGVRDAAKRLETVGVRAIMVKDTLAVMELRGGTHIVVRELDGDTPHEVVWDFMVDRIDEARARFEQAGFDVTDIERGSIHDGFTASAPEHFRIRVNSSHAANRAV